MSRYLIVIERGERNYSAFVPDLPGCIATGRTRDEVVRNMQRAIEMHVEGMREDGLSIPDPTTDGEWVEVNTEASLSVRAPGAMPRARRLAT